MFYKNEINFKYFIYLAILVALTNAKIIYAQNQDEFSESTTSVTTEQLKTLKAIEKLIDNNQLVQALDKLDAIDTKNLDQKQLAKYHMLRSELFIGNNSDSPAPDDDADTGTTESSNSTQEISITAPEIITESNPVSPMNSKSSKLSKNNLWQTLVSQPKKNLNTKNTKLFFDNNITDENTILGWLELARITKNIDITNNNFYAQISEWQQKFSSHPAKEYINNNYKSNYTNKTIVALLPLSGSLASTAKAIKQGLITAYYLDKNKNKPELIFIDTKNYPGQNQTNQIKKYYNQALAYNPDLIIGPLDKNSVEILSKYLNNNNHPTTIALNYVNNMSDNFYQFGISAEDEAEQAANKAWSTNYKKSLLLIENSTWGDRVSQSYKNKYNQLGGNIAKTVKISSNTNLKKLVSNLLDTETSQARKKTLELVINNKLSFIPRRRQDFDHIVLITSPVIAKQIKPILKFYYANDIPVIATSNVFVYKDFKNNIYNNSKNSISDLDGVLFCDIPWITQANSTTSALPDLSNTWQDSFDNNIRLYALGIDAYNLGYNLNKLNVMREVGISSNTGHLYIDKSNQIHRILPWATIENGRPKAVDVT